MAMRAACSHVATCVPGLGATVIFCDFYKMQSQR